MSSGEDITKEQHAAMVDAMKQPAKPAPDKITAMRVRKMALLPDGRLFDLHGLPIVFAVEGKRGEEWRPLQHKQRLVVFRNVKLAAAFMHGRKVVE